MFYNWLNIGKKERERDTDRYSCVSIEIDIQYVKTKTGRYKTAPSFIVELPHV